MVDIGGVQVRDLHKVERIGMHSHIIGLGLKSATLDPMDVSEGMVGQLKARKAAGLIVRMIKEGRIAGRALLIVGEPGTGKTALAIGISKSIGENTPFVSFSSSEVFSVDLSKAETLTQAFRKAIGVRIKEETEVLQGEVVQVEIDRPATGVGPKVGKITLKTTDMEAIYDVGSKMVESIIKERLTPGDVVQIDKATGKIAKIGRSISRSKDYDALGPQTKMVACPNGEIQRRVESAQTISLHDIDVINSRTHGYLAVFSGDTGEIQDEVRKQINKKVTEWQEENKAQIVPGVLFIDEAHLLDLECFSFLNQAIESPLSPILIMATNRGMTQIRGSNLESPHGIPVDLLDRCLILRTEKYSEAEMSQILRIRASDEHIELDPAVFNFLAERVVPISSLRYCMQLISTADVIRQRRREEKVTIADFKKAYGLFYDVNRCKKNLEKCEDDFINEQ